MQGPRPRFLRSWALIVAVAAGALGSAASVARASPSPVATDGSPTTVVLAYLAALNRHDGAAVCRLFTPSLRRFEVQWDGPDGTPRTCVRTVNSHFQNYYSRHRWVRAWRRGQLSTTIDPRTGFAIVHLELVHQYICVRDGSAELCRPGTYRRPEIIYLERARAGGWQILRPGLVYEATEIEGPVGTASDLYPPGTPATINGPVTLPAASRPCPSTRAIARSPAHSLQSTFEPNPRGSPGKVPGLTIRSFSVSRLGRRTMCFTFSLAGPPRPDSAYEVFVGTVSQQAAAELFSVEIDGWGNPHALLAGASELTMPGVARQLPTVAVTGNRLQIVGSDSRFALRQFLVVGGTESIQDDEPLVTLPIDAGDGAPLRGCLTFPSGRRLLKGLCGSTPGP